MQWQRPSLDERQDQKLIKSKNWLCQIQRKSGNVDFAILNSLTQDISNPITAFELKYHEHLSNKLTDPKIAPKTNWKMLKAYANSTKVSLITSLLVGNHLVTDILVKAYLFNDDFSKQCTTIANNNSIVANITF